MGTVDENPTALGIPTQMHLLSIVDKAIVDVGIHVFVGIFHHVLSD